MPLTRLTLAIVLCTRMASAQAADITVNDHPPHDQIQSWLLSNNPRLIAWGAHFAREQNDIAALGLVLQLVQRDTPSPAESSPEQYAQLALLDALIQRNIDVPLSVIARLAPRLPMQAAILAVAIPSLRPHLC